VIASVERAACGGRRARRGQEIAHEHGSCVAQRFADRAGVRGNDDTAGRGSRRGSGNQRGDDSNYLRDTVATDPLQQLGADSGRGRQISPRFANAAMFSPARNASAEMVIVG
jgi:hypothetical protein